MDNDLKPSTLRSSPMTTAQQLALVLNILSSNSFQLHAGDVSGVSQSTASRVMKNVTDWFVSNSGTFIEWPTNGEQASMKHRIYQRYGLPGINGAIDGTHVKIIAPSEKEDAFVNRKGFHSLNIAAIVDDSYKFIWFSARWPGKSHDSRVWRESKLHQKFVDGHISGRLVGDSAYRGETFMLKNFGGQNLTVEQLRYNNAICAFRVHVEQAFGQLKRQFHCLHSEIRYPPKKASAIVATCICYEMLRYHYEHPMILTMLLQTILNLIQKCV